MKTVLFLLSLVASFTACSTTAHEASYFYNRTIKLEGNGYSCSAEEITAPSGKQYILTAAHCKVSADDKGYITAISEAGKHYKTKIIKEDSKSDLLLLRPLPRQHGLEIAKSVHRHEHVSTYTHGLGLDSYSTEGELIQDKDVQIMMREMQPYETGTDCMTMPKYKARVISTWMGEAYVCIMEVKETFTTAFVTHGSSGGMVVNDAGELVGVVSAGGDGFGLLVTFKDIKNFLSKY